MITYINIAMDILVIGVVAICLYTDIKERKIYNKILLPGLLGGVVLNVLLNGLSGLAVSGLGFGLGLGFLLIPFALGGIGGGDVKLLAVVGAIKGWEFVFYTALGMGVFGGLIAVGILIYQGRMLRVLREFLRGTWILVGSRFKIVSYDVDSERYMFPYGVAITLGVATAFVVQLLGY